MGDSKNRSQIWFPCIFRPDETKPPQKCHQDDEEFHTCQAFSKTHPRTCRVFKKKLGFLSTRAMAGSRNWRSSNYSQHQRFGSQFPASSSWSPCPVSLTGGERHEGFWLHKLSVLIEEVVRVKFIRPLPLSLLVQH